MELLATCTYIPSKQIYLYKLVYGLLFKCIITNIVSCVIMCAIIYIITIYSSVVTLTIITIMPLLQMYNYDYVMLTLFCTLPYVSAGMSQK